MDYEKLGVGLIFACIVGLEIAVLNSPVGVDFIHKIRCTIGRGDCYTTEAVCIIRYSSPRPCLLTVDEVVEHNRAVTLAEAIAPKVIYVDDPEMVKAILEGMGDGATISIQKTVAGGE